MKDGLRAWAGRWLTHPRWPFMAAGLAVLLTIPILGAGLFLDDYFVRLVVLQPEAFSMGLPHPLDTFCFINGDPERIRDAMEYGAVPWWVNPDVKGCFWRPLTSLTHFIDYRLWPESPWLMHLQSVLWYAALALAAALLYRRLMGGTLAAGLAGLMFAVEDAHSVPSGWLANRNSMLAGLFGILAIMLHHAWRTGKGRANAALAFAMLSLSLLSAEAGIATTAYIGAYALVYEQGPWRRRLASLVPYAVVVIAWRALWSGLGYGIENMPLYADPLREPLEFMRRVLIGLPQLITGQFVLPYTELQVIARTAAPWTWLVSLTVALGLALIFRRLLMADRTARLFGLGALLAAVPVCSTLAQNRNLMFIGIGAFGLLALWLTQRPSTSWPRLARAAAGIFIALHLILAPLTLGSASALWGETAKRMQTGFRLPGMQEAGGRYLVVVNHLSPVNLMYFISDLAVSGKPLPAHARVLTQAFTPVTITRTSERALLLDAPGGMPGLFSRVVFTVSERVKAGGPVELPGMTARVLRTDDKGIPVEAEFTFGSGLEDGSFIWLYWADGEYRTFVPPAVGESVNIPGRPMPFELGF